jgi:chromosome segregation ATPase
MRKLVGIGAIVLGAIGLLVSAAAIGVGWRTAVRAVDRIDRITARLENGLSETDVRLARVEARVSTIHTELNELRGAAETIGTENPELPRVRAEFERLLDRLVPALDRVDATADSLRSVAAGLRAAADIVDQLNDDPEATVRVRIAADAIDRAAEALNAPRAKVDALKSAKSVEMTRRLVNLVQSAVANSNLLAEGLAAARLEIVAARTRAPEYRDKVVFRIDAAATANTLIWLWGGLGQLCLIGWGRRKMR